MYRLVPPMLFIGLLLHLQWAYGASQQITGGIDYEVRVWPHAGTTSVLEAQRALEKGLFTPVNNKPVRLGQHKQLNWFYLQLRNKGTTTEQLVWTFYLNGSKMYFYQYVQGLGFIATDTLWGSMPWGERPVMSYNLSYPVSINQDGETKYLVCVEKNVYDGTYIYQTLLPYRIWFVQNMRTFNVLLSFVAVFVFVGIMLLLQVAIIREYIYLWRAALAFTFALFTIRFHNIQAFLLPDVLQQLLARVSLMEVSTFTLIVLLFNFYDSFSAGNVAHRYLPSVKKFALTGLFLTILFTLFSQLGAQASAVQPVLYGLRLSIVAYNWLGFLLVILYAYHLFPQAGKWLKSYLASAVVLIILSIVIIISQYQTAYYNTFLIYCGYGIAFLIHLVLLILLTMMKYRQYKTERQWLEKQNAEIRQRAAEDILNALEEERNRVATELHDGINGHLGALRLFVNSKKHRVKEHSDYTVSAEELLYIQEQLDLLIHEIRNLSHQMLPPGFEGKQLTTLLQQYIARIAADSGIHFNTVLDEHINIISKPKQLHLLRIVAELCRNIYTHSKATEATVQIIKEDNAIQILVEDNGIGFNTDTSANGVGLQSIKARVQYMGGTYFVESNAFQTTFILEIPL